MGDARAHLYDRNGFGVDGGVSLWWTPIKLRWITIYIPTRGERAMQIHDLHHVVTGYPTDFRGEGEVAAWELASGCRQWPAAFMLNLVSMVVGAALAPHRIVRAWARGRHASNLYGERDGIEHLLPRTVGELRAALGLDRPPPPVRIRDVLEVAGVIGAAVSLVAVPVVGVPVLVALLA